MKGVEESVREGKATIALGELPYTSRAKKVLEFAMTEARDFNHSYVCLLYTSPSPRD